ncbi:MAG: UTP--glucose-1-phosphate uridylyltransferase [Actinobacteria bacterium]|nr:UTP--glucose-1-phosphate uridylyltransferase [Actinomycetota bacterium]
MGTRLETEPGLAEGLARHRQEHLLRWWDELGEQGRGRLARQIEGIDFGELDDLIETLVRHEVVTSIEPDHIEPIEVSRLPTTDADRAERGRAAATGADMLSAGEVAVVIVAGGQGTRLGFDGPKGAFPIGPVSDRSLFQVHAEKVQSIGRRHGHAVPLYVMTSPDNHAATAAFWEAHENFGLEHVRLFPQGQMPAVDRGSGRVLLAGKSCLALSPDGHGGALAALAAPRPDGSPSYLDEMERAGTTTLFYFQVDNPLTQIADPAFLGRHREAGADVSFKVIEKQRPDERVGVVVTVDGRPDVIEYSDLPPELAERRRPDGRLALSAGSIATHVFELGFVRRLVEGGADLPYHRALKKVTYLADDGNVVKPNEPNAVKFEKFIFDSLRLARRYAIVEADRRLEFEPLKNATGSESPETVRARLSDLYAGWLEEGGVTVVRRADGLPAFPIEISPLYALDAEDLRDRVQPGLVADRPLLLS